MKKLLIFIWMLALISACSSDEEYSLENTVSEKRSNYAETAYSSDVAGSWAEEEIIYMLNNGYMSGYPDGSFRPGSELTRAEFATMISNCLDPDENPGNQNVSFSDITNHWAEENILQVAHAGYLSGFPDGTFKPDQPITKTQILVSIANGLELSGGNTAALSAYFNDAGQIADWAEPAVANAVANQFIYNYPDKRTLSPNSKATRAEATTLLYRAMNYLEMVPAIDNPNQVRYAFSIHYPNPVNKGESITFSGKTADVTKIKFSIDGYSLRTIDPDSYHWEFSYTFNSSGNDRDLKVELFRDNTVIDTNHYSLTIKENVPVITNRQQYDVAVGTDVYKLSGRSGFFYEAEMTIDADGSPHAYHPDDIGLDYLANAGYPGNWWGIATDSEGNPYIQRSTDPAPGYYVSTTAMTDSRYETRDPRRYANSETLPFLVLPAYKAMGADLGDFAVLYNQRNGKYCYAIYADIGPTDHLGEASMKAAELLGINSNPKSGGQSGDIVYLVFPGSRTQAGRIPSYDTVVEETSDQFEKWGGIEQLEYFY
jgi:hypothetical protein